MSRPCSCARHRAERLSDAEATRVLATNIAIGVIHTQKAEQRALDARIATVAALMTPEQRQNFIRAYEGGGRPAWDL